MKYLDSKKNTKIYLIEWHDAHSSSGWFHKSEAEKFIDKDKCICQEVGYIISETKDEICLASRKLKWAEDGDAEWGMLQKIPKTWIRKKILINKTTRRVKK